MRIVGEPVKPSATALLVGADLAQDDVAGQPGVGQRGAQFGQRALGRGTTLPPQQLDRSRVTAQSMVQVSPVSSRSASCSSLAGSVAPRWWYTGRGTWRKIPIGVGAVGRSASLASENARPGIGARGIVDERAPPRRPRRRRRSPGSRRRRGPRRARPRRRTGSARPRSRRIWLASVISFSVSAEERAVVEDRAVLVDLDQRSALVRGGGAQHLGQVLAIAVDRPGDERRLRAQRQRDRVERMVGDPERRRLGDLAQLRGRRRLPLGQPVDLVVEQQDLDRDVAAQRVDQVVAADRQRVAVAGHHPDRRGRRARPPARSRAPAHGRGCRASRTCPCSRRTVPRSRSR